MTFRSVSVVSPTAWMSSIWTNQICFCVLVIWMSHLIGERCEPHSSPDAKNSIIWFPNWSENFGGSGHMSSSVLAELNNLDALSNVCSRRSRMRSPCAYQIKPTLTPSALSRLNRWFVNTEPPLIGTLMCSHEKSMTPFVYCHELQLIALSQEIDDSTPFAHCCRDVAN